MRFLLSSGPSLIAFWGSSFSWLNWSAKKKKGGEAAAASWSIGVLGPAFFFYFWLFIFWLASPAIAPHADAFFGRFFTDFLCGAPKSMTLEAFFVGFEKKRLTDSHSNAYCARELIFLNFPSANLWGFAFGERDL